MHSETILPTGPQWLLGRRFYKVGDHNRVWVVSAIEPESNERPPFAVLISQDALRVEDVDLSHLDNLELYAPVP